MKTIIGLTGQTGAGKSSTKNIAENLGFFVIDCDIVAKNVTNQNDAAKEALVNAFSEKILNNGKIDRRLLAAAAFKNKQSTLLLNKTLLPFIVTEIKDIIKGSSSSLILLDAPTLFESGINNICQKTIAVLANTKIRKERIILRDNLTDEAADLRLNAGKDDDFYKQNADYVIYNNNTQVEFLGEFENILKQILGGK
ncbi:MAG: dephospho-CoA kinase [Clostridia bacterium]|nr:dephospho-CoA kinase [Clostridia bacterium]